MLSMPDQKTEKDYSIDIFMPPSYRDARKRGKEESKVHYDFADC